MRARHSLCNGKQVARSHESSPRTEPTQHLPVVGTVALSDAPSAAHGWRSLSRIRCAEELAAPFPARPGMASRADIPLKKRVSGIVSAGANIRAAQVDSKTVQETVVAERFVNERG